MGNIVQQDLLKQLEQLRQDASAALAQASTSEAIRAWYAEYLGRKGQLTAILRNVGSLPAEERPLVGKVANEVKDFLEGLLQERQAAIAQAELEAARRAESVDVTLPGRPQTLGKLHITTRTLREIYAIFTAMGFQIYNSPDVETDEYNFQLLNMPPGHPARDMWDTFYTTTPGLILRTHTSPGQIHAMREYATEPIRVILPGKVYRYEAVDASHESMFYQVEVCNGQGCPVCKYTGWLEILGAGMVHPRVLENGGYDPSEFSGFAFGMGPDRIALQKYSIDDIRYFYTNDMRLLERI